MKLINGDCLEELKKLPSESVHAIVTDPPAAISFMGCKWDSNKGGRDQWIGWLTDIMVEASRVLKPGGHALVWAFPRTSHFTVTAIENAGFEIRDVIVHLFSSGFPKNMDLGKILSKKGEKSWSGWGTALRPSAEHWVLARKPLSEKTVADNVVKHEVGGLNIDACRVFTTEVRERINGGAKGNGGVYGDSVTYDFEPSPLGRFPANLVMSHSEECGDKCTDECAVTIMDSQSGITKSGAMKREVDAYNGESNTGFLRGRSGPHNQHGDSGGASRFFYCAKPSREERNIGLESKDETLTEHGARPQDWENQDWSKVNGNYHPTLKPLKLMEYLVTLITPPNGTVLDMFMGSGTTGLACVNKGFDFVGIEREKEYFEIASKRIAHVQAHKEPTLFEES